MKKIFFIFLVLICYNANSSENVINNLKIVKKENENSKDLSGNAIECSDTVIHDENTLFHSQATIFFKTKNKAKFAISGFKTVSGEIELFEILIPGEVVNYKVLENKIVLNVDKIKNVYDPYGRWGRLLKPQLKKETKGQIWIWRKTLKMTNLAYFNEIKCRLVDTNDTQLFDKYYEFQKTLNKKLQKQKKDSESKNIL